MKGLVWLVPSVLLLAACGGSSSSDSTASTPTDPLLSSLSSPAPAPASEPQQVSCSRQQKLDGGHHYTVTLTSHVDGADIVFEVFEPKVFDCVNKHPLILEGHGFGGSRQTEYADGVRAPIQTLTDAGYAMISIDQRGHGDSGGTVRVLDPDTAGRDLIQILDWAEANLDYLAYRKNNLLLGAVGGSYGGGYQYLLYSMDPKQRMDAMVPQITWYNLDYSLNPGAVPKSYWGLVLSGAGDSQTGFSMDPLLRATLIEAGAANSMPDVARDFFSYHSLAYSCQNPRNVMTLDGADTGSYTFDPALQLLPVTADGHYAVNTPRGELYPVDVMIWQGFRDTLFNFNEAYASYECLQAAGGDVRLLSYPLGHHYLQPSIGLAVEGTGAPETFFSALTGLAGGEGGVASSCAGVEVTAATLAWFDEKLRGKGVADDVITSGQNVCLSLTYDDAVVREDVPVGGVSRALEGPGGMSATAFTGLPGAVPALIPLGTLQQDAVLAGIPTLDMNIALPLPLTDYCQAESDPLLYAGSCDAILFVGLGVLRTDGAPELIDEQVLPVRGLGEHHTDLVGVAERLHAGDQLFLLAYGAHPTFVTGLSKDLSALTVQLSGSVSLPLLDSDGQALLGASALQLSEQDQDDALTLPSLFSVEGELDLRFSVAL